MSIQRVALYQIATLKESLALDDATLPPGSQVIFVPATIAEVVRLQGQSLSEAWTVMQANIAEAVRQNMADAQRLHKLELWAIEQGFDPNN